MSGHSMAPYWSCRRCGFPLVYESDGSGAGSCLNCGRGTPTYLHRVWNGEKWECRVVEEDEAGLTLCRIVPYSPVHERYERDPPS